MKRLILLVLLLAGSGGVIYYTQRQKMESHVGAEALVNAVADTQREISHLPAGLARLSDEDETRSGDEMASVPAARFHIHWDEKTDAAIEQYVNLVGRRVALHAKRKLNYRFHFIPDSNFINAFALPGGHIFIGKGLMRFMDSEDELASVLGHEVEHVDNYHCNERIALEARLRHIPLSGLVQIPMALFEAGYSKNEEFEADRDGTYIAVMAGYSPQGAIRMFQAFKRMHQRYLMHPESPNQEISQVALESIAGYFRSHPLPEERELQIRQLMADKKWPEKPEQPLRISLNSDKTKT